MIYFFVRLGILVPNGKPLGTVIFGSRRWHAFVMLMTLHFHNFDRPLSYLCRIRVIQRVISLNHNAKLQHSALVLRRFHTMRAIAEHSL